MKIFLSGLGARMSSDIIIEDYLRKSGIKPWNLVSYYYIKNKIDFYKKICEVSELVLVDSGAHSFQKGKKVDWDKYTDEYAEFIKKFDRPNVIGYFEMDVDNVIGYQKVLELRKKLEAVSDKIIPVWHKNRGIDDFYDMCKKYSGKIVAITGLKNEDITDEQYLMFLKVARSYGCKVHCLGMTRKAILDKVPFDYTDSSSWAQDVIFGKLGKRKVSKEYSSVQRNMLMFESYKYNLTKQQYYYKKWRKVCKD